jgi:hypothetical protein
MISGWWELRPLQQLTACPDLSSDEWAFLETMKISLHSIHATLDSVRVNIINQTDMTLPCFQFPKMEETNDLKIVIVQK